MQEPEALSFCTVLNGSPEKSISEAALVVKGMVEEIKSNWTGMVHVRIFPIKPCLTEPFDANHFICHGDSRPSSFQYSCDLRKAMGSSDRCSAQVEVKPHCLWK